MEYPFAQFLIRSLFLLALTASVSAATFLDHIEGTPYRWSTSTPISYRLDPGGFGAVDTSALVSEALAVWQTAPISVVLSFVEGPPLAADVNLNNFASYMEIDADGILRGVTDDTVVIFDETGEIIDQLFGGGASNIILGLASPSKLNTDTRRIGAGLALINGKNSASTDAIKATMVHEFGHMLNLAHTQLGKTQAETANAGDDDAIPTMYPVLPPNPSVLTSLHKDDEWSMALLYPNGAALASRARIKGRVQRRFGQGVQAVNVICRKTDNPQLMAVSVLSDPYWQGEGEFECGHLDGGSYHIEIEPVELAINSFVPYPPYIEAEFYNGSDEGADPSFDNPEEKSVVTVTSGQTLSDITMVLNESGRLSSGRPKSGALGAEVSNLNYFIHVPKAATSLTIEAVAQNEAIDIDLIGRCDTEFSLTAGLTAPNFYNPDGKQQAEISSVTARSKEKIVLNKSTSPKLAACTYHFLVLNNSLQGAGQGFTLTATLEGPAPTLRASHTSFSVTGNGEQVVAEMTLQAKGDDVIVSGLTLEDQGTGDLSRVSRVRLIADLDKDGKISESDRALFGDPEVSFNGREIRFEGPNFLLPEDGEVQILIAYTLEESARAGWALGLSALCLLGLGFRRHTRRLGPVTLVFALGLGLSCRENSRPDHPYQPEVNRDTAFSAVAAGYGTLPDVRIDEVPTSVEAYFNP